MMAKMCKRKIIGPQGTSIVRRSPRVCRIPYKSGQLFSHFKKKKIPRKCNKIQEHFLNVGKLQISFLTTAIRAAAVS
jgi:hypothetical protein